MQKQFLCGLKSTVSLLSQMKILFITDDFIIEPLGIMYLSASLKKAGHEVEIVKTIYKKYEKHAIRELKHSKKEVKFDETELIDEIKKISPDILAYSVTTGMHKFYLGFNRTIREKVKALSVFGGPHTTFFPEMIEEEYVDAICIGEGEEAFVEFVNKLEKKKSVREVKNFWIKESRKIYRNGVRPLTNDLNKIEFPDRELIYKYESSRNNPIKNFFCMRGCPYNCTYCFNHSYRKIYKGRGKIVRTRRPSNVLKEIKEVKEKYPLEIVYFQDDTFILDKKWLNEFLPRFKAEIGLPYHCHLRANLVDEDVINLLKQSGCLSVTLALETADDNLRNNLLKRGMNKEQIHRTVRLLKKHGIKFRIENMIGLPSETIIMALKTLIMNIKCRPDIGWASLYQPYPKTELGEYCEKKGLCNLNVNSIMPSFFERTILKIPKWKKRGFENLQKFFSITVEFPFLLPFVLLLINMPQNRLFGLVFRKWKEYCYKNRLYKTD